MITETILASGLIERKSDRGVYIRNEQTGDEYFVAVDLTNEDRKKYGLEEYTYVETEKAVEARESRADAEEKAKAYDILVGGAE